MKVQKAIIRDFLSGANGRAAVPNWRPAWLVSGDLAYTDAEHKGAARARMALAVIRSMKDQRGGSWCFASLYPASFPY